jgi:hypothetical protein
MVLLAAEAPVARQVQKSAGRTDVAVTITNKIMNKTRYAMAWQLS